MATQSSKEEPHRQSGPIAFLGGLSASGLSILGIIYVMGYVIVNGYQVKYLNYSANALQLKHLAAGLLYIYLTSLQVLIVAFFVLFKRLELKSKKGDKSRWFRLFDQANSIVRYIWAIAQSLLLVFLYISYFFLISSSATTSGTLSVLKRILPWIGINLLFSLAVVVGLYRSGIKRFERAFPRSTLPPASSPNQPSMENDAVPAFEIDQSKRIFVEALASRIVIPLVGLVLLLFSLTFFQELYGRLRPDYGGGALYRVAIHLKPPGSAPSPSSTSSASNVPTPSSTPLPGSIPSPSTLLADWKESLKSNNSWLLLVDRDASFVYVLRVDKDGKKQLLEISSGEIEAIEVLADPPISPADAPFFIQ